MEDSRTAASSDRPQRGGSFPEPDSLSIPLLADALDHSAPRDPNRSGEGTAVDASAEADAGAEPGAGAPSGARDAMAAADTQAPKPLWRGWIHAGTFPIAVAAGIVLISLAEGAVAKWASAVFMASSMLLFGISALYHRFNWKPRTRQLFRRLDHANIFLLIAGTYTPIALLALPRDKGLLLLALVWGGALLGIGFRVFWIGAPRWLYVPLYVVLGWAAIMYVVDIANANLASMVLVVVGGLLYTAGSVVYGTKRPNPLPGVFGFHEIFHSLTVLAFLCHWTAALLVALDPVALR